MLDWQKQRADAIAEKKQNFKCRTLDVRLVLMKSLGLKRVYLNELSISHSETWVPAVLLVAVEQKYFKKISSGKILKVRTVDVR